MFWTVPSQFLTPKRALNPKVRWSGNKPKPYKVPRMAYVNKMDTVGADFFNAIEMMKNRLHANAVAVQLPIGKESDFTGIIDLVRMRAEVYYDDDGNDVRDEEIPADLRELAEEYHMKLLEAVAETDDTLMEKFFTGETITEEEMHAAIRKTTIANKMTYFAAPAPNKRTALVTSPLDIRNYRRPSP